MAERKAVNKYYPPDWTPDKGSINKYVGQHPLRERAKKISQGIMVIRFELPYNIWCGGCGSHVGMGVRYNAEKKKVGNYYSTPIYRFRMKCHLCDNYFEIETDPKNCEYNVVSGARRKNEQWEPSATETIETTDKEDAKRMAIDAMFKLEHGVEDVQKSKKVAPVLHQLQEVQSVWKDDYAANKLLRNKFRGEKKNIAEIKSVDDQLRKKGSLDISLLPERPEDVEHAKKIRFYSTGFSAHKHKKRREIQTRSWFGTESATPTKLPELSLRKRKGSSTEKNDDWKKSVLKRTSSFSPDKDNSALNTPTSGDEHEKYRVCNAGINELAGSECSREKEASENNLRTEGNYQEDINDTSLDTQCTNGSLTGNCSLDNSAADSSLLVSSLYSSDTSADDDDTND